MEIEHTNLKNCFLIYPSVFEDERGDFQEFFNEKVYNLKIGNIRFVQDNVSVSQKGVLRGLHFQIGESSQAKLVSVLKGKAQDVVVDLRPDSSTFGNYCSVELSEKNRKQIFIPRGFAHGFLALEENTILFYKCDNFYDPNAESGVLFNDPYLKIEWCLFERDIIVGEKDKSLKLLKDF